MTIKFSDVVGMDYEPEMRLLVLAKVTDPVRRARAKKEEWWAVVLADHTWEIGRLVTVAPTVSGFLVIEEGA